MCLLALSCSMNHLFVLPSGGGRPSIYGTDPHFDSASGALHGVRFPLRQADRRSGFHRNPDARHLLPSPPGARVHKVDFVTEPRRSSRLVRRKMTESTWACQACSTRRPSSLGFPRLRVRRVRWDDSVDACSPARRQVRRVPSVDEVQPAQRTRFASQLQ